MGPRVLLHLTPVLYGTLRVMTPNTQVLYGTVSVITSYTGTLWDPECYYTLHGYSMGSRVLLHHTQVLYGTWDPECYYTLHRYSMGP